MSDGGIQKQKQPAGVENVGGLLLDAGKWDYRL